MAQEITFTKQADGTWKGSFTSTGTRTIIQVERQENAPLYLNISADDGQHNVIYQPPKPAKDQILSIDIAEGALITIVSHSAVTKAYYIASELDYYTKDEIDDKMEQIHQFEPVVASSLPTASADTMYKFYFIPKQSAGEQTNTKEEWMTVKEGSTYRWEKIGETEVDLSDYVTAEDLETTLATFENRDADAQTGKMGYKILDPTRTFAEQVTEANTIYEIRDVFDLNGETVTIPRECVLKFNGGQITNRAESGGLILTNTNIDTSNNNIFKDVIISGTSCNIEILASWFGLEKTYTLTTAPDDVLVNTEAQATASKNTEILNNYIIPFMNSTDGTLVIDVPAWINNKINRIANFNIDCKKTLTYIGEDDINGAVLEIGGVNRTHTVRITNNWRHSLLKNPEYGTNGVWDSDKAYQYRKDYGIIGVLISNSNNSVFNVMSVNHFTTNVMVSGGGNYFSYSEINILANLNAYRSLVFNFDAGWITECLINKGNYKWQGSPTTPFEGHGYAIVFEKETGNTATSNMIFDQLCVEGAYCVLYIKNVNLQGCEFKNIRDEGVSNRIIEEGTIQNDIYKKSTYYSYDSGSKRTTEYKTIVDKNTNISTVANDFIDVNVQAIYGELDSNNRTSLYSFKDQFILNTNGRVGDLYYDNSDYKTTINNSLYAAFNGRGLPAIVFDNSTGYTIFSGILLLNNNAVNHDIGVKFYDVDGNTVVDNVTYPQYWSLFNNSQFATTVASTISVIDLMFRIPNSVKKIALYVSSTPRFQFSLTSRQTVVQNKGFFMLPSNPVGSINCDFAHVMYFNSALNKFVKHRVGNTYDRWVTADGFDAVPTSGNSNSRPTSLAYKERFNNGFVYFDTTLGKEIYYKTRRLTAIASTNCNKNGIKDLGSNTLVEGKKYYAINSQSGVNDTNALYFCKRQGDLTDALQIPMKYPVKASGDFYTRETDLFVAPNPSEYPYLAVNIVSVLESYKFVTVYNITEQWVDSDGYTANVKNGDTASRPANLTTDDFGYEYADSDLSKKIMWNGMAWVNLDGTALT